MNVYTKHNTIHHDPEITKDQALLYLGTPCRTVCPYDTYARLIAKNARMAFMRGGVQAEVHCCHRRIAALSRGSGPGGGVRMGDNMLPPDVYAVVAAHDLKRAKTVWEDWQGRRFFNRPTSVVGELWYELGEIDPQFVKFEVRRGTWRRGGTWPHVVANAIALGNFLGRDTKKIEAYAARREVV